MRQESPTLSSISSTLHLFSARPWTHLAINESSSLKAYSQYEYFLRKTPSLLASIHRGPPPGVSPGPRQDPLHSPFTSLLTNVTHFTYTAIFPFYNHVETVLHSVHKMPNLSHLTFKLCPEPESTIIADELEEAQGHIDVNDAWMEFDTAYTLITHAVVRLTAIEEAERKGGPDGMRLRAGKLEEFRVDDVKMEGIRDSLEDVISQRLQEWWVYAGEGLWKRKGLGKLPES